MGKVRQWERRGKACSAQFSKQYNPNVLAQTALWPERGEGRYFIRAQHYSHYFCTFIFLKQQQQVLFQSKWCSPTFSLQQILSWGWDPLHFSRSSCLWRALCVPGSGVPDSEQCPSLLASLSSEGLSISWLPGSLRADRASGYTPAALPTRPELCGLQPGAHLHRNSHQLSVDFLSQSTFTYGTW